MELQVPPEQSNISFINPENFSQHSCGASSCSLANFSCWLTKSISIKKENTDKRENQEWNRSDKQWSNCAQTNEWHVQLTRLKHTAAQIVILIPALTKIFFFSHILKLTEVSRLHVSACSLEVQSEIKSYSRLIENGPVFSSHLFLALFYVLWFVSLSSCSSYGLRLRRSSLTLSSLCYNRKSR